ncbi:MAG: hypothetical protein R3C68_03145 [Myxococcota bacterium]
MLDEFKRAAAENPATPPTMKEITATDIANFRQAMIAVPAPLRTSRREIAL